MEDLEGQMFLPFTGRTIELDTNCITGRAGDDIGHITKGFLRCEGFLISLIDIQCRCTGFTQRVEMVDPAGCDIADGLFQLVLRNAWGLAVGATNNSERVPPHLPGMPDNKQKRGLHRPG
jgi:hypothetical protein